MKLVGRGNINDNTKQKVCHNCKSLLEYTSDDYKKNKKGKYIICLNCGQILIIRP